VDVASLRPFYNRWNTLKLQSTIENIQSLQVSENVTTQLFLHKMHKINF